MAKWKSWSILIPRLRRPNKTCTSGLFVVGPADRETVKVPNRPTFLCTWKWHPTLTGQIQDLISIVF